MISGRLEVVSAFIAGACLVALFNVASGPNKAHNDNVSLSAKKAMLKQLASKGQRQFQELDGAPFTAGSGDTWKFGASEFATSPGAEGNLGVSWNYGDNFGGSNLAAQSHGWMSGADTVHSGSIDGHGMFGVVGVGSSCPLGNKVTDSGCVECAVDTYADTYDPAFCTNCPASHGTGGETGATSCSCESSAHTIEDDGSHSCGVGGRCRSNGAGTCPANSWTRSDTATGGEIRFSQEGNDEDCTWTVTPPAGKATRFAVTEMDSEGYYDNLKVGDDACFSGDNTHGGFIETSPSVELRWSSDGSVVYDGGFTITWTFVDMPNLGYEVV
jgi:hypothetical protein